MYFNLTLLRTQIARPLGSCDVRLVGSGSEI